jgi:hypothetical protein
MAGWTIQRDSESRIEGDVSEAVRQALRVTREAAGVPITKLAQQLLFSASHLRSMENGNRAVTRDVVEGYDKALGTGGLLLDLLLADENGDDMRRRIVLGMLGTITGLGFTAPQVIAESLRESLLSAIGSDDWQEVAEEYGQRFMSDPPDLFRSRLTGDLLILRQTIGARESAASRFAAPRLMMLHGMITANLGDAASAARWYRAARITADGTGDDRLREWVRGREAFRRGYEGAAPREVLVLASGVEDVEAKLAVAQAYARLDLSAQARATLDEARRLHDMADQSESTIYAMPAWRMALSSSYVYALLGDVQGCDNELAAVRPPPAVRRWEAQREIQRAVACTRSGDTASGAVAANKVMHEAPEEERSIVLSEMYREATRRTRES